MPFLSVVIDVKLLTKVTIFAITVLVVGAGAALAMLNPHEVVINWWGILTVQYSVAVWLLLMLSLGMLIGFSLAALLIMKLQRQLYVCKRRLAQLRPIQSGETQK